MEKNINELVLETRTNIQQGYINDFIDDLRYYITTIKIQSYIQPKIAEWYNNGGK